MCLGRQLEQWLGCLADWREISLDIWGKWASILSVQIAGSQCFAHPATFTILAEVLNVACMILFFWQKSFMQIAFSRMFPRPSTRVWGGKHFLRCWTSCLCPAMDWKCPVSLLLHYFKLNEQDECFPNFVHRFDHQSWRNTMASGPRTPSLRLQGSQRPSLHVSAKPLSLNTLREGLEVFLPLRTVPSYALT